MISPDRATRKGRRRVLPKQSRAFWRITSKAGDA
jgi:hypothetical protein